MNHDTETTCSKTESASFSTLITDPALVQSLHDNGITTPTPVQKLAIPRAMAGKDLIVQAQTGSGKTLAFMLPILLELKKDPENISTTALVIAPTRELALQICNVVSQVCPEVKPACIIGGDSIDKQIKGLRVDKRIVVGTPGRLLDLLNQREIFLRRCKQFVLDEADEMLSMGFLEDVQSILKRLPSKRHGMFFSATLSPRVGMLAQSFLHTPETIEVERNEENTPDIKHLFCRVSGGVADKAKSLCNVLEQENASSAIIFCNTKSDTELVEVFMRRRGFNAQRINSDLSQKERVKVLDGLRDGTLRYLIATDVAARGIDISHLELVVNYSIHNDSEAYVHRTGRTGRAGRSGIAISLVAPQDSGAFYGIQRTLGIPFEEIPCPTGDLTTATAVKSAATV
jgi:ATP-dependent RNA helicase DeaD